MKSFSCRTPFIANDVCVRNRDRENLFGTGGHKIAPSTLCKLVGDRKDIKPEKPSQMIHTNLSL